MKPEPFIRLFVTTLFLSILAFCRCTFSSDNEKKVFDTFCAPLCDTATIGCMPAMNAEETQDMEIKEFIYKVHTCSEQRNLREPYIRLDDHPSSKLIHLYKFDGMDTTYVDSHRIPYPCMQIDGMDVDELRNKYGKEERFKIDTFRYGECLDKYRGCNVVNYLVAKIHYAEVHTYYWSNDNMRRQVYLIRDRHTLRTFYGEERHPKFGIKETWSKNGEREVRHYVMNNDRRIVSKGYYLPGTLVKHCMHVEGTERYMIRYYEKNIESPIFLININGEERMAARSIRDSSGLREWFVPVNPNEKITDELIERKGYYYEYDSSHRLLITRLPRRDFDTLYNKGVPFR